MTEIPEHLLKRAQAARAQTPGGAAAEVEPLPGAATEAANDGVLATPEIAVIEIPVCDRDGEETGPAASNIGRYVRG